MSSPSRSNARPDTGGDTIAALATAPGRGSVGIVRVSGPAAAAIAVAILGRCPPARRADYLDFKSASDEVIDRGIALYFKAPNSFTGEDILELQGHGGPVVMDQLLTRCLECGARQARPGEFSERAFLNDKLDLAQAEAIADLINASSNAAARQAMATLKGVFSTAVEQLADDMVRLRVYVEAAIDFPEEEVDFLSDGAAATQLGELRSQLDQLLSRAEQGVVIREGLRVALVGRPNAGKSSLLNALAGEAAAIVTDIPGTTRDVLRREINLDGLVIQLADTAGLRATTDPIEHEGIARAQAELTSADLIALLIDITAPAQLDQFDWLADAELAGRTVIVLTKCDRPHSPPQPLPLPAVALSAQTGKGLAQLVELLKQRAGLQTVDAGGFSARRRHLQALQAASDHLSEAADHLQYGAGELMAEELRLAHDSLGEITGKWHPDDLLGEIFGSFCIGK